MRFKKSSVQRSFDITVITRKDQIEFNGIDRNEFDEIVNYFKSKNVKIGSEDGDGEENLMNMTVKIFILNFFFINFIYFFLRVQQEEDRHLRRFQWICLLMKNW